MTSSASGSAPDAARSLRLTAAARKPSSRQVIQSSRKWTPSTSASCVTTSPPPSWAASCSTPTISPRRSSSASRPSSPASDSLVNGPPQARVGRGADHGDPGGAGDDAGGGVRGVDAADRDHRRRDRGADRPAARRGRAAARRRPSTASPTPGPRRGSRRRRPAPARRRRPSGRAAGRPRAPPRRPRPAGRDARRRRSSSSAASTSSLTTNVDRQRAEAEAARDDLVRRRLHAQLHDGRAGVDRLPRRLEVGDDRVHLHVTRARSSSVAGSSAASAS